MTEIPNSKTPISSLLQGQQISRSWSKQLKINAAVNLAYGICRLWFSTCRVRILHPEIHDQWAMGNRPYIGATWHRGAIFYCYYFGPCHHLVMFSQSEDGEYLARFAQKCGMIPVRGSSTRGGQRALVQMIRHLREGRGSCATVIDGPQGPRFVAKKGLLVLAKNTGAPLLPGIWSSDRVLTLEKTWDRTLVPKPFSTVVVGYREPLFIPRDCSDEDLEGYRLELERRLNDVTREVDDRCGYKTRW
ncbi:MAG: lysophospholipid acyltransferase family protein [Desulfobacterota bacterium]|jgi:hypothetical protein|nr:lysophospholipid acyltransferase family protein [Thermodesulfobacteriota bacterium]